MPKADDTSPRQRLRSARKMLAELQKRRAAATRELDVFAIDSMLDRARRAVGVAERDLAQERSVQA